MHIKPLYLNPNQPIEVRVKDLLCRMTLEEKVAQLGSIWAPDLIEKGRFSKEKARELLKYGIGQISRISGGFKVSPKEAAEITNQIQSFLLKETRLGIPAIIHEECLSGFMAPYATIFPQAIGLASTWNPELIHKIASRIRVQMRTVGAHQGLSPVLDIARDPRWGRTEETFGEDPYLVARMASAYVKGLQGDDLRNGVIATPKHFVAHGFPEGGRNLAPAHLSPREMREIFLFPFEVAIKEAIALSIMNAYHEIDGIPCASSKHLLTDILREEWDFDGFVVSDYSSIRMLQSFHHVAAGAEEAAVLAIQAGIDVELPRSDCYGMPLIRALKKGKITEKVIDEAVFRVLKAKFKLGIFEKPYIDIKSIPENLDSLEDRLLSYQAARESIVLLKNDGILPIPKDLNTIALIGPNAASKRNLLGDYSYAAHLGLDKPSVHVVSILEGIRTKLPEKTRILYSKGCEVSNESKKEFEEALQIAKKSDVIVAVLGERSGLSSKDITGEGRDRSLIRLPQPQELLLKSLTEIGKPLVVVLVNGRPLSLGPMLEKCSAILEAWFPGEEGGNAVADILFGDYNPSGKLPISFPSHSGQIPIYYNRKRSSFRKYVDADSKPIFPFGHGLSYTHFSYQDLKIEPQKVDSSGSLTVTLKIKNTGKISGEEVVQLYVRDEVASVSRPIIELKGFKKINLKPGEEKKVRFRLYTDQLSFYDRKMKLVIEPGRYTVTIGSSSEDIRLKGFFTIGGSTRIIKSRKVFFSNVTVCPL